MVRENSLLLSLKGACVCFLVLFLATQKAWAWGIEGHAVVADIAERFLTRETSAQLHTLLGVEGHRSLRDIASWADEIRGSDPELPMHSVRIPLSGTRYDKERHCRKDKCVVSAIERYRSVLRDVCAPEKDRLAALKFVVHLVGDVHQPLHASANTGKMAVLFAGEVYSLHKFWDTIAIRQIRQPPERIAVSLINGRLAMPSEGTVEEWAIESRNIARDEIFPVLPSMADDAPVFVLPETYLETSLRVVRVRLFHAGVRLAHVLNTSLGQAPGFCQFNQATDSN